MGRSAAPRLSLQAGKPREGESLAPLADNLARRVEPGSDEVVGQAFIGKEDDLGANHVTIR